MEKTLRPVLKMIVSIMTWYGAEELSEWVETLFNFK